MSDTTTHDDVDFDDLDNLFDDFDGVAVEGGFFRLGVQRPQQLFGRRDPLGWPADPEHVAAVGDLHAQAQLDLAQVAVEGAGQVGQARAVSRFQCEVVVDAGAGHGGRVPHHRKWMDGGLYRLAIN